MKNLITISISTLLLTTACTESNWMSDGYTWNNNFPASNSAKTSPWSNKTEKNTGGETLTTEAIVGGVAGDIVQSLELSLVRTTPIYLAPVERLNATTSVFDHKLRTKLSAHGYTLSSTPDESHILAYDIKKTKEKGASEDAHDFIIFDLNGEEPIIVESRTQEISLIKGPLFN